MEIKNISLPNQIADFKISTSLPKPLIANDTLNQCEDHSDRGSLRNPCSFFNHFIKFIKNILSFCFCFKRAKAHVPDVESSSEQDEDISPSKRADLKISLAGQIRNLELTRAKELIYKNSAHMDLFLELFVDNVDGHPLWKELFDNIWPELIHNHPSLEIDRKNAFKYALEKAHQQVHEVELLEKILEFSQNFLVDDLSDINMNETLESVLNKQCPLEIWLLHRICFSNQKEEWSNFYTSILAHLKPRESLSYVLITIGMDAGIDEYFCPIAIQLISMDAFADPKELTRRLIDLRKQGRITNDFFTPIIGKLDLNSVNVHGNCLMMDLFTGFENQSSPDSILKLAQFFIEMGNISTDNLRRLSTFISQSPSNTQSWNDFTIFLKNRLERS